MTLCQHRVQEDAGYECSACVTTPAEQPPISLLMADIVSSMFAASAATTNTLLDLRQATIDDLEAERYAIRTGVQRLLELPYMPWPDAFAHAVFYPDPALTDEYKAVKGER